MDLAVGFNTSLKRYCAFCTCALQTDDSEGGSRDQLDNIMSAIGAPSIDYIFITRETDTHVRGVCFASVEPFVRLRTNSIQCCTFGILEQLSHSESVLRAQDWYSIRSAVRCAFFSLLPSSI